MIKFIIEVCIGCLLVLFGEFIAAVRIFRFMDEEFNDTYKEFMQKLRNKNYKRKGNKYED